MCGVDCVRAGRNEGKGDGGKMMRAMRMQWNRLVFVH